MSKKDTIGFTECNIITDPIDIEKTKKDEINSLYTEYFELFKKAKTIDKKIDSSTNFLTERLRLRQKIELIKAPNFISLSNQLIQENNNVCIFVNFVETANFLYKELQKIASTCLFTGEVSNENKEDTIKGFNNSTYRIIILTIQSGGVGISLHDAIGIHKRYALISPTDNARDFKQTLGRITVRELKPPLNKGWCL